MVAQMERSNVQWFVTRVTTFSSSREKRVKDPKGYHLTFSYKLQRHIDRKTHMMGHVNVYVDDPQSLNVMRTNFAPEKVDITQKTDMSKKPDATIYKGWG
ncbi:hypothetical protein E4U59_007154 [Claviceps monticola]|nr:hypothetical protein E4U59_007154 [Claviceps monticola]